MNKTLKNLKILLEECQNDLGYHFGNIRLLFQALTHSSFAPIHKESNERLEFLGDSVLGLVITNYLYRHFPESSEGELSVIKGTIVSRKSCRQIAQSLSLDEYLFVAKGIDRISDSMISNMIEAIIGAIFLDGGYEEARSFVERVFSEEISKVLKNTESENHKADLQDLIHRTMPGKPLEYILLDEKGPQHKKCFQIAVRINHKEYPSAWGNSKKEAEQKAALNAIHQINGDAEFFYNEMD
ncbi:MAG: ribonuclease III [Planctomycetia bacterium]|nr:ribonuclease III [Planctomycetia bacterium]